MDYRNVTFRQLFITGTCLIFPITFWNMVQIMTDFSKNNGILSLFLMLILALVYVVLLHLALSGVVKLSDPAKEKTEITGAKVWNNKKKVAIASIYVIRYAIRVLFLLYFFVQGSRILMLPDYAGTVLVVPVLLALFYMAGKGLRGYIGFAEASVIGIGITLVLFIICGFWNADFSRLKEYVEFQMQASVCNTICQVLIKGYLLIVGLSMLEFVMYLYLRVEKRRRGMLVWTVSVPVVLAIVASCFVISLLGLQGKTMTSKGILNVVGAMMFPGGANARLGLLACYLLVIFGLLLLAIHIVFVCQFVDEIWKIICVWRKSQASAEDMEEKRSLWIRGGCVVVLFLLFLWMGRFLGERDAGRAFMSYIAAVDIPLSVLVPAFAGRKRTNPGKLAKMAAEVIGGVLITCILSGCMDRSIEAVDYLRVVMISETEGGYEYTFVTDSLEGAESAAESEEREYPVVAESLQQARAEYDQAHDRSLDLSHVEYIMVDSEETLRQMYPELIKEFVTNYVEVICTDSLYQGEASGSIRKYIAAHYKGECLATLGE
ncbi:hypothetical protein H8S09_00530 [Coprococcus sp. NSJ-10]|uniref:Uncharacterized protein n=1 Tax=Coprococcus hominis (ex Liu et al. 2022) TaxID=2763039 RepID=A0A8I0DSY1_9FIRM|nr:hypothetical protein [Coprococcus hominis (ex Liu et al. 2022)]MBC5661390.1 hypothetical protein [Coprococcus hominis (ex Liu et al. 2022)]